MISSTKQEWLAWVEVQKSALRHWLKRDFLLALQVLEEYLAGDIPVDVRSDALAFCGRIRREQGRLKSAQEDYFKAHSLSSTADYHRYALEITLGSLCEDLNEIKEAKSWYIRAMKTAVQDPTTSGDSALQGLLNLQEGQLLEKDDMALCIKVVRQAWALFKLPGEPELSDLHRATEILQEASGRSLSDE